MKLYRFALPVLAIIGPSWKIGAAQTAPVPRRYSISGVVMSEANGQPLDRATVSLETPGGDSELAQVTTGAEGSFRFDHLAAGKYNLSASRNGYISSAYDAHDGFTVAIVTGDGLATEGLVFRLAPRAVINGTITDDFGDPVAQARVSLYRQNERNGLGNIVRAGATVSDDRGVYEFARLEAGNYFLAVQATPWYTARSQGPQTVLRTEATGSAEQPEAPRSPLDVAYPITFYADTTDSESATPIPVKAGDRIPINFTLHAVPAVHLLVRIPAPRGGAFSMPQLQQDVFGTTEHVGLSMSYQSRDRDGDGWITAELNGIAPGHYTVQLTGPRGSSGVMTSVDATTDTKIDTSGAQALAEVSGKIAMAGGAKFPVQMFVGLRTPEGRSAGGAAVDGQGNFHLRGVAPGTYQLWTNTSSMMAVTQLTATGATVEGHLLKIGSQPVTLAAIFAAGTATVTGFARRDGKAVPGVMVLLAPLDPRADREMFRRDESNSDGSFVLNRVVPGDYTLVAIDDGWNLDWAHPAVIAHYLEKGRKITISPQAKEIALRDAIEVQSK